MAFQGAVSTFYLVSAFWASSFLCAMMRWANSRMWDIGRLYEDVLDVNFLLIASYSAARQLKTWRCCANSVIQKGGERESCMSSVGPSNEEQGTWKLKNSSLHEAEFRVTVTQLVKKLPDFWNLKINFIVHRMRHWTLHWARWFCFTYLTYCFRKIHFNIIRTHTTSCRQWLPPFIFSHQKSV